MCVMLNMCFGLRRCVRLLCFTVICFQLCSNCLFIAVMSNALCETSSDEEDMIIRMGMELLSETVYIWETI